jgi:tetratricopeptide (TPR) repeat protein
MSNLRMNIDGSVRCGIVAVLLLFLFACAPRPVYIPREWQEKPPGAGAGAPAKPRAQTQTAAPTQPRATSSSNQFLLKRAPAIKEAEVPLADDAKPAPGAKKPAQPQHLASMHLVEQANAALAQGKTDSAISLFEQAVQVDVHNGGAFFGLARAWRTKGSRPKAMEFARKAEILFQDDRSKLKELYLFEASVFKDLGDKAREEEYRQKASRLTDGKPSN